jgi:hypothetical protein
MMVESILTILYQIQQTKIIRKMVGASRFGGQVLPEGAQSKRHFISRSHPAYSDGFTAGPAGFLTNSEA